LQAKNANGDTVLDVAKAAQLDAEEPHEWLGKTGYKWTPVIELLQQHGAIEMPSAPPLPSLFGDDGESY